ncbi:MAG: Ig-like domain-containing protein [Gemmatimonadales bacterium]|jgi:hypothetical protein
MIAARILRRPWPTAIGTVVVLSASACNDVGGPSEEIIPPPPSPAIISNPVAGAAESASGVSLSGSSTAGVVYVSVPPGSFPDGEQATIRNRATGAEATAVMADGGFDPVAVAAIAGDTLDFRIELATVDDPRSGESSAGEGEVVTFFSIVPPRRPPIVVRTDPPPKKRDVPLNATMLVVFSEPIDAARLTASSVQLLLDGAPVAGTLEFGDAANLTATFTPADPLAADGEYTLLITDEIEDLDGEALEAPFSATFTTSSGQLEAVVHVSLDPDAPPEGSTVVSGLAEAMVRVAVGGQVLVYDGTYPTENVIVDRPVTIEAAPGAAPIIQVVDLGGEVSQRTAFRLDVDSGSVIVRNLAFEIQEGYAAIYADGFDQLEVEGSNFTLGRDVLSGVLAANPATPTALATVRSGTFIGGTLGVFATQSARVDVFESSFSDHGFGSIQYQNSATGRIEGNTVTECGINGCINVVAAEQVEIVGNQLATTAERVTGYQSVTGTVRLGISVGNGTHEIFPPVTLALIENNILEGLGGSAFPEGAIKVSGSGSTEVTSRGNLIRSTVVGVAVSGVGLIHGSDNRLEVVDTAWVAHGGTLVDNYSDAVEYDVGLAGNSGVIDVRCNWWGSDAGPQKVFITGDLTVSYTPWATQPVAGTGDRSCTP